MVRRRRRFSAWLTLAVATGCAQGSLPREAPETLSTTSGEAAASTVEGSTSQSNAPPAPPASLSDAGPRVVPADTRGPVSTVPDGTSIGPSPSPPDASAPGSAPIDGGVPTAHSSGAAGAPNVPEPMRDAGTGGSTPIEPEPLPVAFVLDPSFVANPNPAVPLAGVLSLSLDNPAPVELTVSGGDESWTIRLPSATEFVKPILGLKPATAYSVSLKVKGELNTLEAGPLDWTTPALPEDFPPFETTSEPSAMEPGMTLFNVRMGWDVGQAALIAVDAEGVVRWYYLADEAPVLEDPRRLPDGSFLFNDDQCTLRRVDALGDVMGHWHAADYPRTCEPEPGSIPVAIDSFHHDVNMLGDDYLVLSTRRREVENYPTSEVDPDAATETAQILECVIAEFTPEGEVTKYIAVGDLLDTTRVGRDSLSVGWSSAYVADGEQAYDWDHCNSVVYEESSDAYYVSLRHQDAVIKVDRSTESLLWILGTPSNWAPPWSDLLLTPVGELKWPFHQHSAQPNRFGLGMYDNGRYRAAAYEDPEDEEYSRAVTYAIDEEQRTVTEVWSYGATAGDDYFYSSSMGDADWLPATDNVLIVNAQVETGWGAYAQILEVTQDGTRVFELNIGEAASGADGWSSVYTVYRAERIPDLRE